MEVCNELKPVPMLQRSAAFEADPKSSLWRMSRVESRVNGFANIRRDALPPSIAASGWGLGGTALETYIHG
jgi:hypothetical protein